MNQEQCAKQRPLRFESHALVDVRLSRWNPFSVVSAVMLDLSIHGFKLEFVSPVKLLPGDLLSMTIPLAPFHIASPKRLKLGIQMKWFDARSLRCGGIFVNTSANERFYIEQIVSKIVPEMDTEPLSHESLPTTLYPEDKAS